MICGKCKKEKQIIDFHFRNKKNQKRKSWCKDCSATYKANWYKTNIIKYRQLAIIWAKGHKREVQNFLITYLSTHPCKDCGMKDIRVLDFDHRNKAEKSYSISRMISMSIETIKKEIVKCDIRCANCHRIRTAQQFNWYKNDSVDKWPKSATCKVAIASPNLA